MTKTKSASSSALSVDSPESTQLLYSRWSRRRTVAQIFEAPDASKTQQQFKDECDMNNIVRNAQRGIEPRFLARGVPQFGDFSEVPDLATAFNIIQDAQEAFLNLPSGLRAELGNDPTRINEITRDQAERYKLLKEADLPAAPPSPASPAPSPVQGEPKANPPSKKAHSEPKTD